MIYGNAIGDFKHRDPELDMLGNKIGDLTSLNTLDKTSLVAAINEVLSSVEALEMILSGVTE